MKVQNIHTLEFLQSVTLKEEIISLTYLLINKNLEQININPKYYIMKTALLKQEEKSHLTIIKNNSKKVKNIKPRLFINTLYPNFTYQNSTGEIISPETHVLL